MPRAAPPSLRGTAPRGAQRHGANGMKLCCCHQPSWDNSLTACAAFVYPRAAVVEREQIGENDDLVWQLRVGAYAEPDHREQFQVGDVGEQLLEVWHVEVRLEGDGGGVSTPTLPRAR